MLRPSNRNDSMTDRWPTPPRGAGPSPPSTTRARDAERIARGSPVIEEYTSETGRYGMPPVRRRPESQTTSHTERRGESSHTPPLPPPSSSAFGDDYSRRSVFHTPPQSFIAPIAPQASAPIAAHVLTGPHADNWRRQEWTAPSGPTTAQAGHARPTAANPGQIQSTSAGLPRGVNTPTSSRRSTPARAQEEEWGTTAPAGSSSIRTHTAAPATPKGRMVLVEPEVADDIGRLTRTAMATQGSLSQELAVNAQYLLVNDWRKSSPRSQSTKR